jgi:phosphoribosyl-ATP pyrophosphohydrolase/phosphoribosyl-AMP cyclohydrolase/histidinol dehydrogenase
VAALAYGAGPVPAADIVVGPGNLWVTAAKQIVAADVAIDIAAGPSELVVIADGQADPELIAADLLAQAEHDPLALPMLLTTDERLVGAVEAALADQLAGLPTADTARRALAHGGAVVCRDDEEICRLADRLAPEHLELHVADRDGWRRRLGHCGALFVGAGMAEVFGDYGIGPNHVLPTGGAARRSGGLSVLTFLRLRTWLEGGDAADPGVIEDTAWLARQEGLEAHARAAEARRGRLTPSK